RGTLAKLPSVRGGVGDGGTRTRNATARQVREAAARAGDGASPETTVGAIRPGAPAAPQPAPLARRGRDPAGPGVPTAGLDDVRWQCRTREKRQNRGKGRPGRGSGPPTGRPD